MSWLIDITKVLQNLSAIEERTKDLKDSTKELNAKLNTLIERISRVELRYEDLARNLKAEIVSEVRADIARVQAVVDVEELRGRIRASMATTALNPAKPDGRMDGAATP